MTAVQTDFSAGAVAGMVLLALVLVPASCYMIVKMSVLAFFRAKRRAKQLEREEDAQEGGQ